MTTMNHDVSTALMTGSDLAPITPFPYFTESGLNRVRQMYAALVPTRTSLAVLFALDAAQTAATDQWVSFFIETASAQLIWDQRPTGVLSEQDAVWLLARFDEAPTLSVMALLVRVVDEAHRMPTWLPAAVRHRAALFRSAAATATGLTTPRKDVAYLRLVA